MNIIKTIISITIAVILFFFFNITSANSQTAIPFRILTTNPNIISDLKDALITIKKEKEIAKAFETKEEYIKFLKEHREEKILPTRTTIVIKDCVIVFMARFSQIEGNENVCNNPVFSELAIALPLILEDQVTVISYTLFKDQYMYQYAAVAVNVENYIILDIVNHKLWGRFDPSQQLQQHDHRQQGNPHRRELNKPYSFA